MRLLILLCLIPVFSFAQDLTTTQGKKIGNDTIVPQYPGGIMALNTFLRENIMYPKKALRKDVAGRVIIKFTVNKDGVIEHPFIVKSVHPLLDSETLRVVRLMPKWNPATINGVQVSVLFNLPINFKLE